MTSIKKIIALILCAITVVLCFAGCSKAEEAAEITDETMLIAYTEEKAPFIYTENGNLTGFDVEIFKGIFNDIKNEYKNYEFVKVDEGYKVGEDPAYIDAEGKEYIAYVMIGGVQTNTGTFNKDFTFSESVIDNRIITVTASGSKIATYADMAGAKAGVVTDQAKAALDKNASIKASCKSVKEYADVNTALADLDAGKIDAVVVDEFSFMVLENKDSYAILNGELDTINYVYAFKKNDWYVESINEAIYQLKSPNYNDADNFTPLVEKYFKYNASNFNFVPDEKK
ncbi:MAG: transporter substrate-binding domain-containing protein [Acetobacter sp.]|nr:transporter substrate-binding domain-containing protein [Bacteroides sp.]MCM1341033.1 transporter substrate-binding domain-containing protein [Acetobacter sp.]MCM1432411.1 transporter substrate-binding domain-containing protein [Clostridiales bacterium]